MKLGTVELKNSPELEQQLVQHGRVVEYQMRRIASALWFVGCALLVAALVVRTAVAAERK